MSKRARLKLIFVVLCIGWCALFLRCETTEKSMVRAVYLAETEQGTEVLLWAQAPEAAADASEASATLQLASAAGATLEKALDAAQKKLPQTADYRLCDYLLIPWDASDELLSAYEQLVLTDRCGRTAARVSCTRLSGEELRALCEEQGDFSDKLLAELKASSAEMPRLYQHGEPMLLPVLTGDENAPAFAEEALLRTPEAQDILPADETEMARLLSGTPGTRSFWLNEKRVEIRRCSVSVTIKGSAAVLRLDCQLTAGEARPTEAQRAELEALVAQTVQDFWQQGTDLLALCQRQTVQGKNNAETLTTKNACPEIRADVHFLGF